MFLWNVACDGNKFLEFPLSLFPFIPLAFILKKKKKKTRQDKKYRSSVTQVLITWPWLGSLYRLV